MGLAGILLKRREEAECQQQMLMYIYHISEDDSLQEFDWIEKGKNLIQIVNIENFQGCEKSMIHG